MKTTNPLNHAFPHAKLKNITLTKITRLRRWVSRYSISMVGDPPLSKKNWQETLYKHAMSQKQASQK